MDILFENNYTRNKELAKEIYGYYYFKRKVYIFTYIVSAFVFLLELISAFLFHSFSITIFICITLVALLPCICYFSQVNAMVSRDKELCGQEIEVKTIVTNEFIQNTASNGSVNKLDFDKVKRAIETKNLILLHSKANLVYIFKKDSFSLGTKKEFISFLEAKGITIKNKRV